MSVPASINVGKDLIEVGLLGGASIVVTNVDGDTLTYADNDELVNSGTLTVGASYTSTVSLWIQSASVTSVQIQYLGAATPGAPGPSTALLAANNLADLASIPTAVANLGLPILPLASYAKTTDLASVALNASLTGGSFHTSITVPTITNGFPPGYQLTLNDGAGHTQTISVGTAGCAPGVTTIPTVGFTANFSYPSSTTNVYWQDWGPAIYRADQAARKGGGIVDYPAGWLWVSNTTGSDGAALSGTGITIGSGYTSTVMHRGQGKLSTILYMTTHVTFLMHTAGGSTNNYTRFGAMDMTLDLTNVYNALLLGGVFTSNVRNCNLTHLYFDVDVQNAGTSYPSKCVMYNISSNFEPADPLSSTTFNDIPTGWYAMRDITIKGDLGMIGGGGQTGILIAGYSTTDLSAGAAGRYTNPVVAPLVGDRILVDVNWDGTPASFPTSFAASCGVQLGGDGVFLKCIVKGWYRGAGDDNEMDSITDCTVDGTFLENFNGNMCYFNAHGANPLSVATGTMAVLDTALTSGVAPTSLSVLGLNSVLTPGTLVTVKSSTHSQTFTMSGTTTLNPVSPSVAASIPTAGAANANFSYPLGSTVILGAAAIVDASSARLNLRMKSYRFNTTGGTDPVHITVSSEHNCLLPNVTFTDCDLASYCNATSGAQPVQIYGRIGQIEGSLRITEKTLYQVAANSEAKTFPAIALNLVGRRCNMNGLKIRHNCLPTIDLAGHTSISTLFYALGPTNCTYGDWDLDLTTEAVATIVDTVGGGTITNLQYKQGSMWVPVGFTETGSSVVDLGTPTVSGSGQQPGTSGTLVLSESYDLPSAGTLTVAGITGPMSYTGNNNLGTLTGCRTETSTDTATAGQAVAYPGGVMATDFLIDTTAPSSGATIGGLDGMTYASNKFEVAPGSDSGVSEAALEYRFLWLHRLANFNGAIGPQLDTLAGVSFTPDAGVASHIGYSVLRWLDGNIVGGSANSMLIGRANGATGNLEIGNITAGNAFSSDMTTTIATSTSWSGSGTNASTAVTGLSGGPTTVGATYKLSATTGIAAGTTVTLTSSTTGTLSAAFTGSTGALTLNATTTSLTAATPYFLRFRQQGNVLTLDYFANTSAVPSVTAGAPDVTLYYTLSTAEKATFGDLAPLGYCGWGWIPGGAGATATNVYWLPQIVLANPRMRVKSLRTAGWNNAAVGLAFSVDAQQCRVLGRLILDGCDWRTLGVAGSATELVFTNSLGSKNDFRPFVKVINSSWLNIPAASAPAVTGTTNVVTNFNPYPVTCHTYAGTLTTPYITFVQAALDNGQRPLWTPAGPTLPGQSATHQIAGATGDHGGIVLQPGDGIAPTYSSGPTVVMIPQV